jgi:hypothetical protein
MEPAVALRCFTKPHPAKTWYTRANKKFWEKLMAYFPLWYTRASKKFWEKLMAYFPLWYTRANKKFWEKLMVYFPLIRHVPIENENIIVWHTDGL